MCRYLIFCCIFLCGYVVVVAQTITTVAGTGCTGPVSVFGIPATTACIGYPAMGSFDAAGNYYFGVNFGASRILKISPSGILFNVAGNGTAAFSGDGGPATNAAIRFPSATVDLVGNIYIADRDNHRVRKVDASTGIINTIAGNGLGGYSGDGGPATAATLWPGSICKDVHGNIFVNDSGTRIRRISPTGIITTVAGNGILGYSGDGGPATSAEINPAYGLCADSLGNLFMGGYGRIRKVDMSTGIIQTIAGNGINAPYLGDGPATSSQFIAFVIDMDQYGNIFIADYGVGNQRILKLDTSGFIRSIAGTGIPGYSGDGGPATSAQIYNPEGVSVDPCGNVYIADDANSRIRKIAYPPILITPTISLAGVTSVPVGGSVTITATVASAGSSYLIHWMNHGLEFTTTTVPFVIYTKPPGIDTITARIVPTGWGCWDSTTSVGHIVSPAMPDMVTYNIINRIIVYPNPGRDEITISTSAGYFEGEIAISNILGQIVLNEPLNKTQPKINIGNLPTGIYLVRVIDNEGNKTITKIVKE